jgi:hypothetical protein
MQKSLPGSEKLVVLEEPALMIDPPAIRRVFDSATLLNPLSQFGSSGAECL